MQYLAEEVKNSGSHIHFFLAKVQEMPERIYFTYQELVRNAEADATTSVACFSGAGKKLSEFFVIKGMKGEVVIARDPEVH